MMSRSQAEVVLLAFQARIDAYDALPHPQGSPPRFGPDEDAAVVAEIMWLRGSSR